jgi:hypothetical protein
MTWNNDCVWLCSSLPGNEYWSIFLEYHLKNLGSGVVWAAQTPATLILPYVIR